MTIRFFRPNDALRDVVARLYVHESEAAPIAGLQWLIVPDGELKLIFPYRGAIACRIGNTERLHAESRLIISGMRDQPGHLRFPGGVGAVGVILHAHAVHRLTGVPQHEIANRTLDGEDMFGHSARNWPDLLMDVATPEARVQRVQNALLSLLQRKDRRDSVFDYALQRIRLQDGRVRIDHLAREINWSRRKLSRAFHERVGVAPKRFASVLRFHRVYKHLLRSPAERRDDRIVYDHYYDQSHFLKSFARYSGLTPAMYSGANDYGRFYIPQAHGPAA